MPQQKSVLGKGLASLFPKAGSPQAVPPEAENQTQSDQSKKKAEAKAGKDAPAGAVAAGPAKVATQPPQVASSTSSKEPSNKDMIPGITFVRLEEIKVNPFQPRRAFQDGPLQELSDSIRANGVIQPLIVRKTSEGYQLIAGERRMRASKMAGLKQVPVVVRRTTDRESLELALIENIQRNDLNCIEEALAYVQLTQDYSLTQEEVARRVGKDRATVANQIRLLKLPEEIVLDLKDRALSLGHGKVLCAVNADLGRESVLQLHREIVDEKLSVRQTEQRMQELREGAQSGGSVEGSAGANGQAENADRGKNGSVLERLRNLSLDLSKVWLGRGASKVEIKGSEKRGKITLHYRSRENLDRVLEALQNTKE